MVTVPNKRTVLTTELPNPPITEPPVSSKKFENPFQHLAISNTSRIKQIWAFGGGKGGVGKTLVSSSVAIALARLGSRVTVVDLDLGGANLHTALGTPLPSHTLYDFISGRVSSLQECACDTGIENLQLIGGAHDALNVTNLSHDKKVHLMQALEDLDTDYLILDLGAGTHLNTIDFFLLADLRTVVLLPEPTSIENVYRFIKASYYRQLSTATKLKGLDSLFETAADTKNDKGIHSPSDLLKAIEKHHPAQLQALKGVVEKFHINIILNQARTQTDMEVGYSIKSVCKQYFGMNVDYVGCLEYESAAWQSVRRKRALMQEFPNSSLVSSIDRITHYLLKRYQFMKSAHFWS